MPLTDIDTPGNGSERAGQSTLRGQRPHGMLMAVILLSVVFRIVYFAQLNNGPGIWQHRWVESDMNYFDAWGRQIARGDWLSKTIAMPMHGWHVNVAMEHLKRHPEQFAALHVQATGDPDQNRDRAIARALWAKWSGVRTFYQEPLYPYLIGATYAIFGPDPRWVFLWQMLAGVVTTILIYLIARRCFGPAVAGGAGLLAAFCSPLLYYELILLRETLMVMMGLLLVWLTLQGLKHRPRRWWCSWPAPHGGWPFS